MVNVGAAFVRYSPVINCSVCHTLDCDVDLLLPI